MQRWRNGERKEENRCMTLLVCPGPPSYLSLSPPHRIFKHELIIRVCVCVCVCVGGWGCGGACGCVYTHISLFTPRVFLFTGRGEGDGGVVAAGRRGDQRGYHRSEHPRNSKAKGRYQCSLSLSIYMCVDLILAYSRYTHMYISGKSGEPLPQPINPTSARSLSLYLYIYMWI